jgi:hypothetical protein
MLGSQTPVELYLPKADFLVVSLARFLAACMTAPTGT